jgi:hypothetical protein
MDLGGAGKKIRPGEDRRRFSLGISPGPLLNSSLVKQFNTVLRSKKKVKKIQIPSQEKEKHELVSGDYGHLQRPTRPSLTARLKVENFLLLELHLPLFPSTSLSCRRRP